jgi:hypothetical protein
LSKALELESQYLQGMMVFFKIWPKDLKKTIMTLQILRLKLMSLNQSCISSKSIIHLPKTSFLDPATFIEKKRVAPPYQKKSTPES